MDSHAHNPFPERSVNTEPLNGVLPGNSSPRNRLRSMRAFPGTTRFGGNVPAAEDRTGDASPPPEELAFRPISAIVPGMAVLQLIRLLKSLGVMLVISLVGALLSNLLDPEHGVLTIGIYSLAWTGAFFLAGRSAPAMRWRNVFGVCLLFLVAGYLAGVLITWKVTVLLLMTALVGGELSRLAAGRR
jgi:hypothetical protein